jgi:tetratricopeptide (TPR) repeat protein
MRRLLWLLLLLVATVLIGASSWYAWRRYTAPVPPEVGLADVEPALGEAIQAARSKVQHEPYSAAAWGELGKLFRECGLGEKAVSCFAQAEQLEPGEPRWPYLRAEALLTFEPDRAESPFLRAADLCQRVDTDNLAPALRLAELYLTKGDYEDAKSWLVRAREIEPDNPNVLLNLGLLAYAQEDLNASRAYLQKCLHSPFTQQRACSQLAAICQRQNDTAKAAEFSMRARSSAKDLPWPDPFRSLSPRTLIGKQARFEYLDRLHSQKRHAEAVQLLREMEADGPDYRVWVALGRNLAELGQLQEAADVLGKAIQLAPENAGAYYYRSKVSWALAEQQGQPGGNKERAKELYRAAVADARQATALKPDHALAHMLLGRCLERLAQRREALAALRQAVQCGPDLAEPALHLGELLAEDGQTAEARQHLERAVQLAGPEDPRPRLALDRVRGLK